MNAPQTAPSTESIVPTEGQHVKLTPEQKRKWDDTMSMMIWTAPGFTHLLYKLLNAQSNTPSEHVAIMEKDVPGAVAKTDGRNVVVNPEEFFALGLPERVYVLAHEVVHNVYSDCELLHRISMMGKVPMNDGTALPFSNEIMQKAMDYRINALLDASKIGKRPKAGHFDKETSANDSVLDVYQRVYLKEHPDGEAPGPDSGNNPGGFDSLQKPGQATGNTAPPPRNNQQWGVQIMAAQTIEQAQSQGKMAGALKRMFEQLLEPEVPWQDHIETLINRQVGDGGVDWTQPHPYYGAFDFFCPGDTGKGAGWIVVWGDTSGSRSDDELRSNMAELAGIMEQVNPARLTVIWCDAQPSYIDEIEDPADLARIQHRGAGGGGGTDYGPVLDWIADNGNGGPPDLFIGFTDGYVSHREREPAFPVIWASTTDHPYPFGQVVRVNKVARI